MPINIILPLSWGVGQLVNWEGWEKECLRFTIGVKFSSVHVYDGNNYVCTLHIHMFVLSYYFSFMGQFLPVLSSVELIKVNMEALQSGHGMNTIKSITFEFMSLIFFLGILMSQFFIISWHTITTLHLQRTNGHFNFIL